jgi:hypothetical protein
MSAAYSPHMIFNPIVITIPRDKIFLHHAGYLPDEKYNDFKAEPVERPPYPNSQIKQIVARVE